MNAPDRTTQRVRDWLRRSTPAAPDAERDVDEVMTTLFKSSQLQPRSSFRFLRGRKGPEGGFSMFTALKLGGATAVIALVTGVLAISALPVSQTMQAPSAATESASPEVAIEDLPPYAAITGKMWPGSQIQVPTADADFAGPGTLWHDWAWETRMEVNDPRLNGRVLTNQDFLLFEDDAASYTGFAGSLRSTVGRLENEGGSWTLRGHGFSKPGLSSYSSNHYVMYFTGEDGYEGLTAMLLMVPAGNYWQLDGVIAPGPLPEPPASLVPAAAE
jgi:hypothetical protein